MISSPDTEETVDLSVVIPVYNESENITILLEKLLPVLGRCTASFEVVFVDDGSRDETYLQLAKAHAQDPRIKAL